MQRYFVRCAYHGATYSGWQIQDNAPSVQGTIQEKLSVVFRSPIQIVGCGRTDTGVHASSYYFHFDAPTEIDEKLNYSIQSVMPDSIRIYDVIPVASDAHARYDAISRKYKYQIRLNRTPFGIGEYYDYKGVGLDFKLLQLAAERITHISDFEIFSKKGSEVNHHLCEIMESYWDTENEQIISYYIKANRFLRGMVRLLVGMQINIARGKLSLEDLDRAIENQSVLSPNYSAPAEGLYLHEIRYSFLQPSRG